jgi:hypothetical protein
MSLFYIRLEFSCFRVQVFVFTGSGYMGFSHRWLVSWTRGKTFENYHARQLLVVIFEGVKSYRTSRAASILRVYSLRRICADDEFANYCNQKSGKVR